MPTRERVKDFIATIERGEFLEAIPLFYAENMTARENQEPPRIGRQAQVENETRALQRFRFHRIRVVSFAVDGDHVAIHYDFGMTLADGNKVDMEEIAYQTWSGDRIVEERYFYDPAQRVPLPRKPT
jgi:ketosteroid isomerase-like protein